MGTVTRRADGRLSKAIEIAGGALRIPAALTRTGVFEYRRADGSIRRELRPADEVMHEDSLATLRAAPATDLHPREQVVRLDNRKALEVGHVGDNVRADEARPDLVAADIIVTDARIIDLVRSGKREEISCGYRCDIDATPGEHNGEPYDVVQRNIRYNHAALLPRGHGRAGGDVSLRLDAADNEITPRERVDSQETATMTVKIDGVDYDPSTPAFAQAFAKYQARADAAIATAEQAGTDLATATARADAADEKVAKLEGELATATDPKRLDSLVAERETLKSAARKVAGDKLKLDGMGPGEIRRAVLEAKGVKLDGKCDVYVAARFDSLVEDADSGPTPITAARPAPPTVPRADANTVPRKVPDWHRPCSTSTEK